MYGADKLCFAVLNLNNLGEDMSNAKKNMLELQQKRLSLRRNQLLMKVDNRLKRSKNKNRPQSTDPVEMASENLQNELAMTIAQEEIKEVHEIDDALRRINAGTYGICTNCGCVINIERLKALPYVTLCVPCKELEEKERIPEDEGYSYGRMGKVAYDLNHDLEDEIYEDNFEDEEIPNKYSNN